MNIENACVENTIICTHPEAEDATIAALQATIGQLKDELRHRDRRIEELRREIDEQRELISRLREHAEDYDQCMESWKETFDMTTTESGCWTWGPFWDQHNKLVHEYDALVRDWNRFVPAINGAAARNVGRPLEASRARVYEVIERKVGGESLRGIAEATSLSFGTVRTIVGKHFGIDRTTKKYRQRVERVERIELDRAALARRRRRKRTGDALPRQAQRVFEAGQELITEAKGLGRARVTA